ncbi:MAG: hypothetical protein GXN93_03820 [Candidatus Diapherotrites archaeon]|nr:hypothetical protein [Candidatus Diapherotrites archaeon]
MKDSGSIEPVENYATGDAPVQVEVEHDDEQRYLKILIPYPDHVPPRDRDLFMRAASKLAENFALFMRKQLDYGPRNIADFGELGVLIRVNDKVQRLRNLLFGNKNPQNESIYDSWRDIANYGLIGQLVHEEIWPGVDDE